MGAYGNERTQQSLQDFPVVDSEEEEEKVVVDEELSLSLQINRNGIIKSLNIIWVFFSILACVGVSERARPVA